MDVDMFQGRKILATGGGQYFGHKLGNELKKMGAVVVLFNISRPLDEVVNEQMELKLGDPRSLEHYWNNGVNKWSVYK